MRDFTFSVPTRFVFGEDKTDEIGAELTRFGFRRALLVYGQKSVIENGTLSRVQRSLAAAGVAFGELSGVRPNPEIGLVRQGVADAIAQESELILAIGGGSVIDTAKAIAVGLAYAGDTWDIYAGLAKPEEDKILPVACVLTIPAAGSEGSASSVISNDELGLKRGYSSEKLRPVLSILDPKLSYTLPAWQTACGVCDMMIHILERYFSSVEPVAVTDNIALSLISTLLEMGPRALQNPEDADARAQIMWASTLAHNDLCGLGRSKNGARGRAGGWESHALEHELSALDPNIAHGAGLAVIFPAWARYTYASCPERWLTLGEKVFSLTKDDFDGNEDAAMRATISALSNFWSSLGLPTHLSELGIKEEQIDSLISTLRKNKGELIGDVQRLSMQDCKNIYELAL